LNYQKIYENLCQRGQSRTLDGYKEVHHIIPRCMDGSDETSNLTDLTAREHYLAHRLLCKVHPTHTKLASALFLMMNVNKSYAVSSRIFEDLRVLHGQRMRELHTGTKQTPEHKAKRKLFGQGVPQPLIPSFTGRVHTQDTKDKISLAKKGCPAYFKGPHTAEAIEKNRQAHLGKPLSEAHKLKLSKTYLLTSPQGECIQVTNLAQFCRERGLAQGNMVNVAAGIKRHCKGWKCTRLDNLPSV
jgi:hypothetical protein